MRGLSAAMHGDHEPIPQMSSNNPTLEEARNLVINTPFAVFFSK